MSNYPTPTVGPGFPKIRWSKDPDGTYWAEWLVKLSSEVKTLPLSMAMRSDVLLELSFREGDTLLVKLRSSMKPIRPEVYSHFYQLIRPAFEQGLILNIEGGDMAVHRYVIEGTYPSVPTPQDGKT